MKYAHDVGGILWIYCQLHVDLCYSYFTHTFHGCFMALGYVYASVPHDNYEVYEMN